MNEYILSNHKNNIFAVENFGNNKKILIKDVLKNKKLLNILYEFDCQKVSLTKDGVEFLENYLGLDAVSDMILLEINKGIDFKYTDKDEIIEWLQNI